MKLDPLFANPSWLKVYYGIAAATCGVLGLAVIGIKIRLARKRDIYKPSVLFAETFGLVPEAEPAGQTAQVAVWDYSAPDAVAPPGPRTYVFAAIFLVLALMGSVLSLRDYIVLENWDDGQRRAVIGDDVGAIVSYKKALRANPSLSRTHFLIAQSLLSSGKINAAVSELKWIVDRHPEDQKAAVVLGDALETLGRSSAAEAAYRMALKVDSYDPVINVAYGGSLEEQGKWDEAYRAYESAIQIDKRNAAAHFKLGTLLIVTNHTDEGLAHCKRAVALAPNNALARNSLATAYCHVGEFSKAVAEYRKSISLNPGFPVAYYNLGVTYEHMDDVVRARDAFTDCVKLDPTNRSELIAIEKSRTELRRLSGISK